MHLMFSVLEDRQQVQNISLIIAMQDGNMAEVIFSCIVKSNLVGAAQIVVNSIFSDSYSNILQLLRGMNCRIQGVVPAAVVKQKNFRKVACSVFVKLVKHSRNLGCAVVARYENQYFLNQFPLPSNN